LAFLLSCAIFFIVPLFEEALYLRTPTGELLNNGSPGFFRSSLTNNQKSDTFISARLE
jgi:uncharacterized protein YqhQ